MRRISALTLCSVSAAALIATPSLAQTVATVPATEIPEETAESEQIPPTSAPTDAQGQPEAETPGVIVVTGSRIRRDNYTTPQNVDILTRDDQVLAGTRSTTETLQSATVTSGTSQIGGSFLGYLSAGGQGANVVGLRGLGSTRTLVLLNGRRLAPAGVGPELVSADLNVLPTAAVQRIEVLREGASSIYGSDAIAGVINIIADTEIDGFTVDAFADVPLDADNGRTYRISGTWGKTFSRGHIMGSVEYRKDEGLQFGDRDDWRCPRELAYVNGTEIGQGSPDDPNRLRCFPFERGSIGTARGYGLGYISYLLPDDFFGVEDGNTDPDLLRFFLGRYAPGPNFDSITTDPFLVDNFDLRPLTNERILLKNTYLTPMETYTAYGNASYELDMLGNAELYGEALFSRRKSNQEGTSQINFQQLSPSQRQLYGGSIFDYDNYYATGGIRYLSCAETYGDRCSPFFPTAWADAGVNYYGPFIQPNRTFAESQRVDFFRGNVGLRGDTGILDWRYDINAMMSRTRSRATVYTPLTQNFADALFAVEAPAGTPSEFITVALPGQAGAGTGFTCAANVTNGTYNGNNCVVINPFDPNVVYNGFIPDGYFDYVYTDSTSRTRYDQQTLNAVVDGSLPFSLPGGTPKIAFGVEHRRDKIDDIPSPERLAGELLYYGTAQRTRGSDTVNEVFGEIQLPLLRDRPGVYLLEANASARYTHYDSYGSDVTYAISGQYAPIRNLRLRANYGTNFRAPNLYEQFIADQIGFYSATLDPCNEFASTNSPGSDVYENCLAELTPILDNPGTPENEALDFFGNGSIEVVTSGGRGVLEAETAKTWGVGAVVDVPLGAADFSFAVDYWNVEVEGQVSNLGNLILNFCYDSDDFPNNEYCGFIDGRVTDPADPSVGQISGFRNPYLNIATQIAEGIDFDARLQTEILGGRFTTQAQATRMLSQQTQFFPGDEFYEYNGEIGYPNAGAGPKWVGSLDTRFTTANDITFRWGVEYVGRASDSSYNEVQLTADGGVCSPAAGNCVTVDYDLVTEQYFEHGASIRWLWPTVGQVTMGVNNIFNEKPPLISLHPDTTGDQPRIGNYLAYGPYDYRGRSFFINVTRSF